MEDHQVQLSSMKSTKYVEPFIKEVDYWEKSLGYVAECIEVSILKTFLVENVDIYNIML